MKKLWLMVLVVCVLIVGCKVQSKNVKEVKIPELSFELPETLTLAAPLPEEYPEKVKSFWSEWLILDEDDVRNVLMDDEIPEKVNSAHGVMYYVKDTYLGIQQGGFRYGYLQGEDDNLQLEYAVSLSDATGSMDPQMMDDGYYDYAKEGDLKFMKQSAVLAKVETLMKDCGIADTQLKNVDLYDAETMQKNLNVYNQKTEMYGDLEPIEYTMTEDDERYEVWYQQMVDGIPVANEFNFRPLLRTTAATQIWAKYSKRYGLEDLEVSNLVDVQEVRSEEATISPEDALKIYAEAYEADSRSDGTEIQEIELCYVVRDGNFGEYAQPCWMIRIATRYTAYNETWNEYETIAVTADTGKIL